MTMQSKSCALTGGILRSRAGVRVAKMLLTPLRLRLQPKQSTPTDSNSSLDSDSAALRTTPSSPRCSQRQLLDDELVVFVHG